MWIQYRHSADLQWPRSRLFQASCEGAVCTHIYFILSCQWLRKAHWNSLFLLRVGDQVSSSVHSWLNAWNHSGLCSGNHVISICNLALWTSSLPLLFALFQPLVFNCSNTIAWSFYRITCFSSLHPFFFYPILLDPQSELLTGKN